MTETTPETETTQDEVAKQYRAVHAASLSANVLNENVAKIATATSRYPANGSIASVVIWTNVTVDITNGKSFKGEGWGAAFPGGGALFGDVYTDDVDRLYSSTASFAVTATPVYTAIYFHDDDANLLGHFQAGALSTVSGAFGGRGKWS